MNADIRQHWPLLIDSVRDAARDIFRRVQSGRQAAERKLDGSLLTATDLMLQEGISAILSARFPGIPVLGEEMTEDEQSAILATGNCWLLDPLDGTSNFSHGIPVYSVSLALLQEGEVVAGLVYDPNRDECFHALKGMGASLDQQPLDRRQDAPIRLEHAMAIIDTKRLPAKLASPSPRKTPTTRSAASALSRWIGAGWPREESRPTCTASKSCGTSPPAPSSPRRQAAWPPPWTTRPYSPPRSH